MYTIFDSIPEVKLRINAIKVYLIIFFMFSGFIQSLISCASENMILQFMHTLFFEIHEFS